MSSFPFLLSSLSSDRCCHLWHSSTHWWYNHSYSGAKCLSALLMLSSQDYWFSLVFKRLVGPKVLAVRVAGLQRKPQPGRVIRDKLRIYAHCTSYSKYIQQMNSFWLVYNLHWNAYHNFALSLFLLRLTDERKHPHILLVMSSITLGMSWKIQIENRPLLLCPLANTWGSVAVEELYPSPINKEVADTLTFTAQSL